MLLSSLKWVTEYGPVPMGLARKASLRFRAVPLKACSGRILKKSLSSGRASGWVKRSFRV